MTLFGVDFYQLSNTLIMANGKKNSVWTLAQIIYANQKVVLKKKSINPMWCIKKDSQTLNDTDNLDILDFR